MADSPAQKIGGMVAALLGDLEDNYGDTAEVLDALIAVEVLVTEENGETAVVLEHRCTTPRVTVAVGLAQMARQSLTADYGRADDEGGENVD